MRMSLICISIAICRHSESREWQGSRFQNAKPIDAIIDLCYLNGRNYHDFVARQLLSIRWNLPSASHRPVTLRPRIRILWVLVKEIITRKWSSQPLNMSTNGKYIKLDHSNYGGMKQVQYANGEWNSLFIVKLSVCRAPAEVHLCIQLLAPTCNSMQSCHGWITVKLIRSEINYVGGLQCIFEPIH